MAENSPKTCQNCLKIKVVEGQKNKFQCHICLAILTGSYSARRHCHSKHCGRVFRCTSCQVCKHFKSESALENHNISVHGEGRIVCPINNCQFNTKALHYVHTHMKKVHFGQRISKCKCQIQPKVISLVAEFCYQEVIDVSKKKWQWQCLPVPPKLDQTLAGLPEDVLLALVAVEKAKVVPNRTNRTNEGAGPSGVKVVPNRTNEGASPSVVKIVSNRTNRTNEGAGTSGVKVANIPETEQKTFKGTITSYHKPEINRLCGIFHYSVNLRVQLDEDLSIRIIRCSKSILDSALEHPKNWDSLQVNLRNTMYERATFSCKKTFKSTHWVAKSLYFDE
jgi:hypothetical protein